MSYDTFREKLNIHGKLIFGICVFFVGVELWMPPPLGELLIKFFNGISPIITAAATIVIASFTIYLSRSTDGLYRAAQAQSIDTKKSLRISEIAANAASKSANIIQSAERAWIFGYISGIAPTLPIATMAVTINIKNFGKTPGIHRETYGEFRFSEPLEEEASYLGGEPFKFKNVIETTPFTRDFTGYSAGTFNLPAMSPPFFFCGYITYLDVFRISHFSRFCFKIISLENKWEPAGSSAYNDFD